MKRTQSVFATMATSLVMIGLAWGVSACTHSTMNASADVSTLSQPLVSSATANVEPRYFGEQFASQQLALQARPDEASVETF